MLVCVQISITECDRLAYDISFAVHSKLSDVDTFVQLLEASKSLRKSYESQGEANIECANMHTSISTENILHMLLCRST